MGKIDKLGRSINDNFRELLKAALKKEFPELEISTEYNFIAMQTITRPVNRKKFTKQQYTFIRVFEQGYIAAAEQVRP